MDWSEFRKGVAPRFLQLPIRLYTFRVSFVEFTPDEDTAKHLQNILVLTVARVVSGHPDVQLSALKLVQSRTLIANVQFTHPVYDFQVELGAEGLFIGKAGCSPEELFLTLPLIEAVAHDLFSANSKTSLRGFPFFEMAYEVVHSYEFNLHVSTRLSDPAIEVQNLDVVDFFAKANADTESAFAAVAQPEQVLRKDVLMHYRKSVLGRRRNMMAHAEAPFNVTQRDFDLTFSLKTDRAPDEATIPDPYYLEFSPIFDGFYRDFLLLRLFPEVFKDIAVVGRSR